MLSQSLSQERVETALLEGKPYKTASQDTGVWPTDSSAKGHVIESDVIESDVTRRMHRLSQLQPKGSASPTSCFPWGGGKMCSKTLTLYFMPYSLPFTAWLLSVLRKTDEMIDDSSIYHFRSPWQKSSTVAQKSLLGEWCKLKPSLSTSKMVKTSFSNNHWKGLWIKFHIVDLQGLSIRF